MTGEQTQKVALGFQLRRSCRQLQLKSGDSYLRERKGEQAAR